MDPVGSWSAYAASYNRLTNTGGIQNGPSGELLGANSCGQGIPSSTPQLLLQAHAGSTMPTASPFTPAGFLSPPPVAYDGVFTPIFHQKAHYGSFQHRSSLKQTTEPDYNQLGPVSGNFFEQPSGWAQTNPQLPSPFGILPHESVVTNASAKPYDNVNPHVQLQSLNHNPQLNTAFADPKRQTQLPAPAKASAFFQQPVLTDSGYKHADYPPRFSYGHIQQPCAVQAAAGIPKEYRVSQPSRILFDQNTDKNDYGSSLSKITSSQNKSKEYERSDGGLDSESQSSPISYAMMDTQRGFQSTKARHQQYQVGEEQSCRFNSDSDYHRKTNDNYSPSEGSDCVGVTRRSPSGHSASPVYPMYNSPMTTISSPSPSHHDACYNKQTNDEAPPLDVSLPHNNASYSSVITRSEKMFNEDRYMRDEMSKQQWDERQRRYTTYEAPTVQRSYEEPNQVCLQDLSSCREDPMSLVKTLQQQVPEKYSDDRMKRSRINQEKIQEPTCTRVPPPAHHNANHQNQNSFFEFDRFITTGKVFSAPSVKLGPPQTSQNLSTNHQNQNNFYEFERFITTGKVFSATPVTLGPPQTSSNLSSNFTGQHPHQSAAIVGPHHGPPLSYLPAFHLSPTQPNLQSTSASNDTEEAATPEPPTKPPPQPPPSIIPEPPPPPLSPPSQNNSKPNIVVPDIEEELSFLTEGNFSGENDKNNIKKTLAPNPNADYHVTYLKFIEGKEDNTSPLNARTVRRASLPKTKPVRTEPLNEETTVKDMPLEEFPSDPQDDPRYYPLPKSTDKRSFETSDSEQELECSNSKDEVKTKNEEKKEVSEQQTTSDDTVTKETNKIDNEKDSKSEDAEKDTSEATNSLDSNDRRSRSQRKARSTWWPKVQEELQEEIPELQDSDSDPVWEPTEDDAGGRRRSKRARSSRRTNLKESSSSSDEDYRPSRSAKKKNTAKKKTTTTIQTPFVKKVIVVPTTPMVNARVRVVAQEKLLNPSIITPPPIIPRSGESKKTQPHPGFPYKSGDFVIATSDQKYYHPPLWRVKDHNMLHRFIHYVKNGVPLYINVPTYTAWSPGSKYTYEPVEVKFVTQIKRDLTVKLLTRNLHKITTGQEIVENIIKESQKYQDHFEIFLQALISQSLDSNFLSEIIKEKDDFFLSNVRVIDEYCQEFKDKLVSALNWRKELILATCKLPSYKTKVSGDNCLCGAKAEVNVSLEGCPYHYKTLQVVDEQINAVEVTFCNKCYEYFQILHKLSNFKQYMFAICDGQVKMKKDEDATKNTAVVLNELLADNDWLSKMFIDTCRLWAYADKLITDLHKNNGQQL